MARPWTIWSRWHRHPGRPLIETVNSFNVTKAEVSSCACAAGRPVLLVQTTSSGAAAAAQSVSRRARSSEVVGTFRRLRQLRARDRIWTEGPYPVTFCQPALDETEDSLA
jgi:hypothetical protein